jgi:hypothetical protein
MRDHPLGDNIEFHGLAPDPNDPDLSWHDLGKGIGYPTPSPQTRT